MDEKSDGTGKLYGIPRSVGLADIYAVDTTTYAMNIRWDIYREAGFPEVTSFDTMLDALKKDAGCTPHGGRRNQNVRL